MSYDQFWHDDPELYWAYQVAYLNKVKFESDLENNKSWLQGLYNYLAYSTVQYNLNKKASDPPMNYIDKPIDFDEEQRLISKQKEQELFEQRMKALLQAKKIILDKRKKEK